MRHAALRRVTVPERIGLVVLGDAPGIAGTDVISVRAKPLQRLLRWSLWLHGAGETPALLIRSHDFASRSRVYSLSMNP